MRRLGAAAVLFLIFCIPASAQSDWRVFGGFSYNRIDYLSVNVSPEWRRLGVEDVNMYGWTASVTQYTSLKWLGATVEAGGLYKTPTVTFPANYFYPGVPESNTEIENAIHTSIYTAMIGPSFAYRASPNVEPFAHVLLGGIYGKGKLSSAGETLAGQSMEASEWAFSYEIGGGADFKISRKVALRGQVDWVRSAFTDESIDRQNNIRVSGGLVLLLAE